MSASLTICSVSTSLAHVTSFVDASLEETRACHMARSSCDEGGIDCTVENAQLGLVDKAIHERQDPLLRGSS